MGNSLFRVCRSVFLVACICSWAWGAKDTLSINVSGVKSAVGVWWPKSSADAPVFVWFHGGMTSGNCEKGLVAGDDLSKLYPSAIVVSASACRENHWATEPMVAIVDRVLDSVAAIRKAPVKSVSLVGVSDGAIGVIVYSQAGSRSVKDRLLVSSNGSLLGDARSVAQVEKFKEGRWRFLQGGSDRLYPSGVTVPWIDTFCKTLQGDCDLKFDQAGEHDWSYWRGRRLEWIKDALQVKK
ncbi:MAG: hypothetical protein J6T62_06715 [Fibrobacter sp.]|nr:hypothetical protein [Fibrobacter sp.]